MQRIKTEPRQNWEKTVTDLGYDFFKSEGVPYWDEDAYYRFSAAEIDVIEAAANDVYKLCLAACEHIIESRLYPLLGLSADAGRMVADSWDRKEPTVYGRFDFIYDGAEAPKLLEFNADTPTALFEGSIVQWNWREQKFPKSDQFNSLHEALVARWAALRLGRRDDLLHITCATPMAEDETTVQYLGQTAKEAGFRTKFIPIQEIGWNGVSFVDLDNEPMNQVFKLYPWEWILREEFGKNVAASRSLWLEPAWKMLLSNKGILPILWELFPGHPNLLPAYREPGPLAGRRVVRKAALGREGADIRITDGATVLVETAGAYADSGYIYQEFYEPPTFDGRRPNLGVWMVGRESHGMVVREDASLIVSNQSRILPHIFE